MKENKMKTTRIEFSHTSPLIEIRDGKLYILYPSLGSIYLTSPFHIRKENYICGFVYFGNFFTKALMKEEDEDGIRYYVDIKDLF